VLAVFAMVLRAQALGLETCLVSLAHKGVNASKRGKALVYMLPEDQVHAVVVPVYPDVTYRRPVPNRSSQPIGWLRRGFNEQKSDGL